MTDGERIYFDWNATTPLLPEVRQAMVQSLDCFGNPSSVHCEGREARAMIEEARRAVAELVGGSARNVIFTASGTEAAGAVLSPWLGETDRQAASRRLLMSAVEHACVLDGGHFAPEAVERLPVDADGRLDLGMLETALERARREGARVLVSLQAANNETGVIQPVAEAARLVAAQGGLLHVDAVQAAGKIPLDIVALGADVLTISAHKFGGPKGAAAIIFRDESLRLGRPLLRGGGQERGQRAGTENVVAIAGMGVAARSAMDHVKPNALAGMASVGRLRDWIEAGIRARLPETVIFSSGAERLPNTICFALPGLAAETALIGFDMDGVALSSGSACSSGKVTPSHVLAAMGVPAELARSALRLSLGPTSTQAEGTRFLAALENRLKSLHSRKDGQNTNLAA